MILCCEASALLGLFGWDACSYFLRSVLGVGSLLGFVVFLLVL